MATTHITGQGIFVRFLIAVFMVFITYNPEEYSYYHWAIQSLPEFSILKGFLGIILLIVWTIYLRATLRSLGPFGLFLAFAFFGTMLWLVIDWGLVPADSIRAVTYIILVILCGVLTAGISWSHIRRRISGQVDVDEIEED